MLFIQVNLQTCIYSDHTYVLNLWFIICKEIQVGNDQEISKHVLIMNAIYDSLLKLPSSEVSVGLNNLTPHGNLHNQHVITCGSEFNGYAININ